MYMRLAFAVAAHLDPEILLIDEVLAVGDLRFQRKCMEHAKRLQEGNNTVLIVSHNMFVVKALCNRVIYIADGQVRFDGTSEAGIGLYEQENQLSPMFGVPAEVGDQPSQRPISITSLELFNESGEQCQMFDYGEKMHMRLTYEAPRQVHNPNFIIAFIRSDNVACCNYSTAMDGVLVPALEGKGVIDVMTPPLKLTSESYAIHLLIRDADSQRLYSSQLGPTFHVRHPLLSAQHFGIFHESAEWYVQTGEDEWTTTTIAPGAELS
jgi:lipopolysaccharide transport system ATP-binding protein